MRLGPLIGGLSRPHPSGERVALERRFDLSIASDGSISQETAQHDAHDREVVEDRARRRLSDALGKLWEYVFNLRFPSAG